MEIQFKGENLKFEKEGDRNLLANTKINNYENIEVNIIINPFTEEIDINMITNILEYLDDEIVKLELELKPLLHELLSKQYSQVGKNIECKKITFDFIGIWIKSMRIFNAQFEIIYYLNGQNEYPNLDTNGKWALSFSGSPNQWHISGVNRIG